MLRRFTKTVGRFREGELHDFPKGVWSSMAASAKAELDSFSKPEEINQLLQSKTRGEHRERGRSGARVAH